MATQASLNFVQELYIAYYGRPADPQGLEYWAERADQEGQGAILNAFGTSQEFTEEYGSLGDEALVNSLYQQLFSRDADQEGLGYYSEVLASGEKSLSEIAVTIMNAAQGSDQEVIDAKVEVAAYYTETVDNGNYDYELAQNLVTDIDSNSSQQEIEEIKTTIDSSVDDGGETPPPADGGGGNDGGETPPPVDGGGGNDGGEAPPTEGGSGDNGEGVPAENTLVVDEAYLANLGESTDTVTVGSDYTAVDFRGVSPESTLNVEGLEETTRVIVSNNSNFTLNLNNGSNSALELEISGSSLSLYGPYVSGATENTGPTTLNVTAFGDSSLETFESSVGSLSSLTLSGTGAFNINGSAVGSGIEGDVNFDASSYEGNLTVAAGVLAEATSITGGSGNDNFTLGDISGGADAPIIDGGEGNDSLVVTGSMDASTDNGYIDSNVSGFESVTFESYSNIDASELADAQALIFQSGGDVINLADGQSVTATADGLDEAGAPMILRDAGNTVNIEAVNAEGMENTLDLKVLKNSKEFTGGVINLTGDADVAYQESGRQFESFNALEFNGDLAYTGADYAQENIELGSGAVVLAVEVEDKNLGMPTGEILATSNYVNMDVVTGFDFDSGDVLVDIDGQAIAPLDITESMGGISDRAAAFESAGSNQAADGNYVSFELDGATYVYSDNDGVEGRTDGDFALQLGVPDPSPTDGTIA